MLELRWQQPTDYEISVISRAPVRLGVTVVQQCVFLLYAWNGGMYGDAPYVSEIEPERLRASHARMRQSGLAVTIHLIDQNSGRECAIREAVVGAPVSEVLRDAIHKYEPPSPFSRHARMIDSVYRQLTLDQLIGTGVWANTAWTLRRRR